MEEELVRQIEKSELELSIEKISGYVDEMDQRLSMLEDEVDKLFEVGKLLAAIRKEFGIGLENVKYIPEETVQQKGEKSLNEMKKKLDSGCISDGDKDLDEGGW